MGGDLEANGLAFGVFVFEDFGAEFGVFGGCEYLGGLDGSSEGLLEDGLF